jgi:hypothetical protein
MQSLHSQTNATSMLLTAGWDPAIFSPPARNGIKAHLISAPIPTFWNCATRFTQRLERFQF